MISDELIAMICEVDERVRDARIAELEAENRELRAMVRFLEQYRPQGGA